MNSIVLLTALLFWIICLQPISPIIIERSIRQVRNGSMLTFAQKQVFRPRTTTEIIAFRRKPDEYAEEDGKVAETMNNFVQSVMESISGLGSMKRNLGLNKKFDIKTMSFQPNDEYLRKEIAKGVAYMDECISGLMETTFLKASACGCLPIEFRKFLNWLIKDGTSKSQMCFARKAASKMIVKHSKALLE